MGAFLLTVAYVQWYILT